MNPVQPSHYQILVRCPGGTRHHVDVLDIATGLSMGLHEGLALKYLVRWCTKGNPVDINKAMESLRRLAEEVARCGDEEEKGA